ncbi:MAG: transcriptional regulator [Betaproteobacteria bacterium HGW-Betaproteobacteria-22]|nr:MAG: transcriptional regulator [Betaproteobacteria bacterium HGW-Betaproteobacteria-22]
MFAHISAHAEAENEAELWTVLQKAAVAARALSYEGVFVCQTTQKTRAVQIRHLFNGQSEFSRNVVLDGSPREMLSQGGELVIYNARNKDIVIEKRRGQNMFPAVLPVNLDVVKDSYTLQAGNQERIADRQAQTLLLLAKDSLRYSYKFWVDKEFGLLLKSAMFNQQNEILESIAFNQLSLFNTVDLDWFKPNIDRKKNYVMEDESVVSAETRFPVSWDAKILPAGYQKTDQMMRAVAGKPYPVAHVVFSDGMASVSLFVEVLSKRVALKNSQVKVTLIKNGNTSFYANEKNGYLVTAVGEVPEATVVQFANAVVVNNADAAAVRLP